MHSFHILGDSLSLLLGSLLLLCRNNHLLACVADPEDVGGEGVGGAVDAQLHPRRAGAAEAPAPHGEAAGGAAGRGGGGFATNCRVNKNPSKAGWEYLSNGRKVSIVTVGGFNKKFTMVAPTVQKREMTMLIDVAFRENRR